MANFVVIKTAFNRESFGAVVVSQLVELPTPEVSCSNPFWDGQI